MAQEVSELRYVKPSCELEQDVKQKLDEQLTNWLTWDGNEETKNEILNAVDKGDWQKLHSRLCNRITFGTAGLRGPMRAGFDSLNDLVVVQTAQGLCEYIKEQCPDKSEWAKRGIVIGYDARHHSKRFAELTAIVFLANNFRVHLYRLFVATPIVPYTIIQLQCLAGVQVTASHNPKDDNGYKVYWGNGAQIISPHDAGIQRSILKNLKPREDYWNVDEKTLRSNALLNDPYNEVVPTYFEKLKNEISSAYQEINSRSKVKFAYTAVHGVGYPYVQEAFKCASLNPPVPVVEQVEPDPEFPTTSMPNPEEGKETLNLAIKTATNEKCDIILANDPDADRLAVAERGENNTFKLLSGNELGALLGWWIVRVYKEQFTDADVSQCVMIASTVSSKILKSMAAIEGFKFIETLTGFKWMGNKAIEEEAAGRKVLFAFEEAIGYMVSTNVLDKDGVSAAAHVATMACWLYEKGLTLQQKLQEIYQTYGYHTSLASYVICRDQAVINKIFKRLRTFSEGQENTYPTGILNNEFEIEHVRDLTTGYDSSAADQKATLPVSSSSHMITFTFKNGAVVTLRTSGTEPKMKYYAEMCGKPEDKNWDELRTTLSRMVDAIVNEFYEPEKNGLARKVAD